MGLDMYLYREIETQNYNFVEPSKNVQILNIEPKVQDKEFKELLQKAIEPDKAFYSPKITIIGKTWRKVNAIHNWFINKAGVEDDCTPFEIETEWLYELKDTTSEILNLYHAHKVEEASKLATLKMPTTSGFFFGSTDIDSYYFQNLEDTLEFLESETKLIEKFKDSNLSILLSYEYRASW